MNLLQPLARVHRNRGEPDGQYSFQRLALGALTAANAKAGNVRQRATGRQARRVPAEADWKSLAVAMAVVVATMVAVAAAAAAVAAAAVAAVAAAVAASRARTYWSH